ncbi:MAG: hypothetical protein ACRD4C_14515, partial [Candidatus Acidiferrales bacterium]
MQDLPYCVTEVLEIVLQPWEENPRELVSWFDMLQFSAGAFLWCGSALRTIRADCTAGAAVCIDGEPGFAYMRDLDERGKKTALER